MANVLITGASGFIGSFLVEEALGRGLSVYAGIRKSSSLQYLSDPRIALLKLISPGKAVSLISSVISSRKVLRLIILSITPDLQKRKRKRISTGLIIRIQEIS